VENPSRGNEDVLSDQLLLGKLLLLQYGMLHDSIAHQLKCYTVACSEYSLGGVAEVIPDQKTVIFKIMTKDRFRFKSGTGIVKTNYIQALIDMPPWKR